MLTPDPKCVITLLHHQVWHGAKYIVTPFLRNSFVLDSPFMSRRRQLKKNDVSRNIAPIRLLNPEVLPPKSSNPSRVVGGPAATASPREVWRTYSVTPQFCYYIAGCCCLVTYVTEISRHYLAPLYSMLMVMLPCCNQYYIMAGRAFVVAKEVFHHRTGNILTLWND